MLLLLLTAASLTMVLSTNSDMLINGYYRDFRGAFYAADSGLNIARQTLASQITAAVPSTFLRLQRNRFQRVPTRPSKITSPQRMVPASNR